jgi:hypothetical protein
VVKAPKIRMHDKLKALDMLAKMAKLFRPSGLSTPAPMVGRSQKPICTRLCARSTLGLDVEHRDQLRQVLLALKAQQVEAEAQPGAG